MKRILFAVLFSAVFAVTLNAQGRFPGVSTAQAKQLATVKRSFAFPLPTWVPAGFKVEEIVAKIGKKIPVQDRVFTVVYSRSVEGGKVQRFAIDAGFDGLGDLMYEPTKTIKSGVGNVILIYEPEDEDGSTLTNYVMTEWITIGKVAFHYTGTYGFEENDAKLSMISVADTEKILKSLKRY